METNWVISKDFKGINLIIVPIRSVASFLLDNPFSNDNAIFNANSSIKVGL